MIFRLTFLTCVFAFTACSCAQSEQDREKPLPSDREARETFFRTLSETRSRGAQEFSYLLFQESVRKEIELSEASAKSAREILSQTRTSVEKLYAQLKAKEITSDELKVKMLEIMTNADRDIWKILGESSSKRDRLVGLFVQHRHCASVLNKIVAEKIGLEESRRQEIVTKKEAVEREMFEERSRDSQSPGDRFRAWEKVQKKLDSVVSEMLTPEQREKLEKLKGEPFKFEEFQGGPSRRGRDGDRDRNRGDDGHKEKSRDCEKFAGDQ